ncbi:hypothetical protein A8535_003711 [Escherichia coli]|uniref:hypothetical protein n=1 Tax=Escherichia coli TaxID=562 RepID=UPI000E1FE99C|nr:hypothetical protein [Escherichia coli]EEV9228457.1 hypothetical protein [Escherichia coli]EFK2996301.1 hypothetical protein [Escherichia coli]EFO4250448.1 hypothetical protein [Escherichia coli]EJC2652711.1 hypothetical protein [Escherichia coli]MCN4890586.1 hypothetical protein [Escherichia coli]
MSKNQKITAKTRYRGIRIPGELDRLIEAESRKQKTTYSKIVIRLLRYQLIPGGQQYRVIDEILDD